MGITKIYQTEWNGISLADIANKLGKKLDDIASSDFYRVFYQELEASDWKFQSGWKEEKELLGKTVFSIIKPSKQDKIISLGAGLGICEMAAIGGGYDVELQEVQPNSFNFLISQGIIPPRTWFTNDFSTLPSANYDFVIMNHISYCFNDDEYKNLICEVKRILKNNGILIVTAELLYEWFCFKKNLRQRLSHNKLLRKLLGKDEMPAQKLGVFWGYLRTMKRHVKLISTSLNVIEYGELKNNDVSLNLSYYICKKNQEVFNDSEI